VCNTYIFPSIIISDIGHLETANRGVNLCPPTVHYLLPFKQPPSFKCGLFDASGRAVEVEVVTLKNSPSLLPCFDDRDSFDPADLYLIAPR
jgi:hypothetical protein